MKVLFVSSGNSQQGISPIIYNQGESLRRIGIDVDYFTIVGKGVLGYLKSIPKLRRHQKKKSYNIVHAHYSLSAFVASLVGCNPLIVSLMGSDVKSKGWTKVFIRYFNVFFWKSCIVKSPDMKESLDIKNTHIVPNGVNFKLHQPLDQIKARQELGWDMNKKHILFAANPERAEKNFQLAEKAFQLLKREDIELHFLQSVAHEKMPVYFAASNVTLLTSLWEGSPNVIKEAMACNCPIVSTDVGDVKQTIGNTEGCYLTTFEPNNISKKLSLALAFNARTKGRSAITHLDEVKVAQSLVKIYKGASPNSMY